MTEHDIPQLTREILDARGRRWGRLFRFGDTVIDPPRLIATRSDDDGCQALYQTIDNPEPELQRGFIYSARHPQRCVELSFATIMMHSAGWPWQFDADAPGAPSSAARDSRAHSN